MHIKYTVWITALLIAGNAYADGWDPKSKVQNINGIADTRHNMTQSYLDAGLRADTMDKARNDYQEVCVYCHTPHGANTAMGNAPLWNRTKPSSTFTTYNQLGTSTLTGAVTQPGLNSLTCLSCHDGVTAIDSIINMPGSGGYDQGQQTAVNTAFLDSWQGPGGTQGHASLQQCTDACHKSPFAATSFEVFVIGTDLKNDHPVGVRFPTTTGTGTDWKEPNRSRADVAFFDKNGSTRPDKEEIRLYNTGDGYEVECASCHDPHGVPTAGTGSVFIPSFLRVNNAGSALCLTCHVK